ncbi:hypothetical protein FRC08_005531 [Ceratobasidium sp. 394]|nr:hypothetical protein FRC08_005531 [Ceratobasidium sp. 394]
MRWTTTPPDRGGKAFGEPNAPRPSLPIHFPELCFDSRDDSPATGCMPLTNALRHTTPTDDHPCPLYARFLPDVRYEKWHIYTHAVAFALAPEDPARAAPLSSRRLLPSVSPSSIS